MTTEPHQPLVAAARGQQPERQPVWFLRQAGRYLPEYQKIRANRTFLECCMDPATAAKITLQPLERFDLDAAIIFSDILVIPHAMGQDLTFDKGHGPRLSPAITSSSDVARLQDPDITKNLGYVGEAIHLVRGKLPKEKSVIGFAGAPLTVASYMIEGGGSKDHRQLKTLAFRDPKAFVALLDRLSEVTAEYLAMQVNAGANALMLFDSWAASLSGSDYRRLVFPSTNHLLRKAKETGVPVIYFPGQGLSHVHELADIHSDVIAVDWRTSLTNAQTALSTIGVNAALQGNLDPQALLGSESFVREKVREVMTDARRASPKGHIFNVGHGLLPWTPIEALQWAIDEARQT